MADVPVVTGSNDGQPHTTYNNIGNIYYTLSNPGPLLYNGRKDDTDRK